MHALIQEFNTEADRETDGYIHGLVIAEVTNNEDTEGLARVRVNLPWQQKGEESHWARVAMPMAMGNKGVYFLPEVGDQVLLGFEKGDPTIPIVIGSLWDGKRKPPEDNGDKKNDVRLIRTRSDTELRFFDGAKPSVELKLKDGKHLLMDDQGIILEDGQGNTFQIETNSGAMTIKSSSTLKLESPDISLDGATITVKASGTLSLKGATVLIN